MPTPHGNLGVDDATVITYGGGVIPKKYIIPKNTKDATKSSLHV
jgi:hypothetical protein